MAAAPRIRVEGDRRGREEGRQGRAEGIPRLADRPAAGRCRVGAWALVVEARGLT